MEFELIASGRWFSQNFLGEKDSIKNPGGQGLESFWIGEQTHSSAGRMCFWQGPGSPVPYPCTCPLHWAFQVALVVTKSESRSTVSESLRPHRLYSPWPSSGQNSGVGSLSLLQRMFPTQGSNPSLLHCRQILYQLSHEGGPGILEWVAYPLSSGSSWSRNQTGVSWIAGRFFTNWATKEAPNQRKVMINSPPVLAASEFLLTI